MWEKLIHTSSLGRTRMRSYVGERENTRRLLGSSCNRFSTAGARRWPPQQRSALSRRPASPHPLLSRSRWESPKGSWAARGGAGGGQGRWSPRSRRAARGTARRGPPSDELVCRGRGSRSRASRSRARTWRRRGGRCAAPGQSRSGRRGASGCPSGAAGCPVRGAV